MSKHKKELPTLKQRDPKTHKKYFDLIKEKLGVIEVAKRVPVSRTGVWAFLTGLPEISEEMEGCIMKTVDVMILEHETAQTNETDYLKSLTSQL